LIILPDYLSRYFNMSYKKHYGKIAAALGFMFCLSSCGSDKDKNVKDTPPPVIFRKDTATHKKTDVEVVKTAPIINISDTVSLKANIIYIKDSASTSIRLSQKLAQIYGTKLSGVIRQNKLKVTGPPMAWYRTQKAPFFFEAGLPVDKKPAKLPKNVLTRTISGGDSVLIAHFYGPYDQTSVAYEALNDWLKDRKKKLRAPSYEVYVTDPIDKAGKPVDPYRVQTDIVFPHN
jgi:effector-binding domain-containing protein